MENVSTINEHRIRRLASRHGYAVQRSRRRHREASIDDLGAYRLVELGCNLIVLGERYDATLMEIANYLSAENVAA